jgi:hypothetical protein
MRNDQRGTAPFLLVPSLGIKIDPHYIPAIRQVPGHYQTSRPTASPKSISGCRLAGVIFFTNEASEYERRLESGVRTRFPFAILTSTGVPRPI